MALDGSGCFPSYSLIVEETGLSRRCVIEHVGKAAEAGYLEVENRQRENGSATSNVYRPVMPGGGAPAALGGDRGAPGGGDRGAPLITTHSSNHPSNTARFEEFWKAYPNKVGKKVCVSKWKSNKLDDCFDAIMEGLRRWKASDRWQRGFIKDPQGFLNGRMWEDIPPAAEPKKGELRVRELSDEQKREAKRHADDFEEFKRLSRLHPSKPDSEIWAMVHAA